MSLRNGFRTALGYGFGYGLGFVGKAASGVAYLLRLDPSVAEDQVLSNGTTYNSGNSDFVQGGDVKAIDTSTGTVQISSGEMLINGSGSWTTTGLVGETFSNADGRVIFLDFTNPNNNQSTLALAVHDQTALAGLVAVPSGWDFAIFYAGLTAATNIYIAGSSVDNTSLSIPGGTRQQTIAVLDKTNDKLFIYEKKNTDSLYTLKKIQPNNLADSLRCDLHIFRNLSHKIHGWKIPETLYTEQITPSYNLTNETAQDTYSDIALNGSFTAVTGQTLQIDYRRSSDGNDSWRVKIAQGSSNNVTLHKVVSGVESAALATASATINNGTSYDVQTHHQDDNYHATYIDGLSKLTYTSTDTHQQTAIGTKLTLGTISTVDIGAFERDTFTFEGVS